MIIHNGITFPHAFHHAPAFGAFDRPTSIKTWYGVRGAKIFAGRSTTRELTVRATLTRYLTQSAFWDIRTVLDNYKEVGLAGPLAIDRLVLPYCVFEGWYPEGEGGGEPFWSPTSDSLGSHGWTQFGVLKWIQIAR